MNAPVKSDAIMTPEVDFYLGTEFELVEITDLARVMDCYARDLRAMHTAKQPISLKICADEMAAKAKQLAILTEHLAKVTKIHINRRPRNGSAA